MTNCLIYYSCALIIYLFGKFVGFWKCKSIIDTDCFYSNSLNRITRPANNSWIFCSSLKTFAIWFTWWSLDNDLNNIYMSPCFFVLLTRLNLQVNYRDILWLQSFLPAFKVKLRNRIFVILFHCQKETKTHQSCQLCRFHQKSPSFDRFLLL